MQPAAANQRKLKYTEIQILFMQTEKSQIIKINCTFELDQVHLACRTQFGDL